MTQDNVKFEVLISCMFEHGFDIVSRSNLKTNCCIINQCDSDSVEICQMGNSLIHKHNMNERGLSRSRNAAILNSNADVVLISDNDEIFIDNLESVILKEYQAYPDADVIVFKINVHENNSELHQKGWPLSKRLNWMDVLKVSSIQISFRRKSILEKNIQFDERFGAGSPGGGAGEENIFLEDCLRHNLTIQYVPLEIATIGAPAESTWFKGYDSHYFLRRGQATKRMLGPFKAFLYAGYYTVAKYDLYKKYISPLSALMHMIQGICQRL